MSVIRFLPDKSVSQLTTFRLRQYLSQYTYKSNLIFFSTETRPSSVKKWKIFEIV